MFKNSKHVNVAITGLLIFLVTMFVYSLKHDESGINAALFMIFFIGTLVAWPIALLINSRINKRLASQKIKPVTPEQLKRFKITRALIIGAIALVIIAAMVLS